VRLRIPKLKSPSFEEVVSLGVYYWTFGWTPKKSKPVLLGPFTSEAEAEEAGLRLDDYEVFELKTKDTAKATRQIKAILADRLKVVDKALQPCLHEGGLKRAQRRKLF